MKHLRIVLTLTITVVLFSVGVFFVESITTPIITKANADAANAAKAEVLPTLADYDQEALSSFADYDVADSGITDIFKIPGHGFVYQAQFQGYQSIIVYMIGFNEDGVITGYKTLQQGDTPGLGAEIGNSDNWTQFTGMTLTDAAAGNIDGLSGATVTTTGWKASLARVINFHNNEMLGFEVSDVTSSLTLPDGVTKVEVVSDGTNDLEVIYTVEFTTTYSESANIYTVTIDLADGTVKSLVINEAHDSEGIGLDIGAPEFAEQFAKMTQTDAIDGNFDVQAGASYPITFGEFKSTFDAVYLFHREQYEGFVFVPETDEEKLIRYQEEITEEDVVLVDVTSTKDTSCSIISKIETVNEDEGYIFYFKFKGYNAASPIEAMISIDDNDKVLGLRIISQNDTAGLGGMIESEDFLAQFDGIRFEAAERGAFDDLSGASITTDALVGALEEVFGFYRKEILGEGDGVFCSLERPEAQVVADADLLKAFPTATSFTSVYSTLPQGDNITNIYSASDASGVIGHVYVANASGNASTDINFVWGVNLAGTTQEIAILANAETWSGAADYGDYSGSAGTNFKYTSWLDNFEGIVLVDILTSGDPEIDTIAGVTNTTTGMKTVAEAIAQYHSDNSVGGGS